MTSLFHSALRFWVACSSSGSQVARRLPGRHSSVAASRCAAGLDLLFGAVPREDRHLGALKVVFCPKAQAGHWRAEVEVRCHA